MRHGDDITQDLIKKIRSHKNMNQTEFAELLNVTFGPQWGQPRALHRAGGNPARKENNHLIR